jgi:hypothetical protein
MWHYQLGLQQGWIPKGEILLCQSEIPPEILMPLLSQQIQEKPSDTAPEF